MYLPRCRGGTMSPTTANVSPITPPAPTPCTPRDSTSAGMPGASPASTDPSRKTRMAAWNVTRRP